MMKLIHFFVFWAVLVLTNGWVCLSPAAEFPKPQGWVTDQAGVIDSNSREKISSIIQELEQKTSAEIAVVTVKNLSGQTVEDYAVKLFQKWGIGKKGKDNGVLILAAIEDRKARIEVGYGLEGILPDGLCGEILDNYLIPAFKEGEYGKGLLLTTSVVASIIARDAGVQLSENTGFPVSSENRGGGISIVTFLILILLAILFIRHPFLFLIFLGLSRGGRGGFSGSGGFGGGFGGFGGGMSGGGGASRSW